MFSVLLSFLCVFFFLLFFFFFFFNDTATTEIYTLSLHDALPISGRGLGAAPYSLSPSSERAREWRGFPARRRRSEEHTSELQSPCNLVCRLLLEKKKKKKKKKKSDEDIKKTTMSARNSSSVED